MSTMARKSPLKFLWNIKITVCFSKTIQRRLLLHEEHFQYLRTSFFVSRLIFVFLWQLLFGFVDSPVCMCSVLICLSLQKVPVPTTEANPSQKTGLTDGSAFHSLIWSCDIKGLMVACFFLFSRTDHPILEEGNGPHLVAPIYHT